MLEAAEISAAVTALTSELEVNEASGSHLDLSRAPYVLYGVKYIDLVSLW